MNAVLDMPNLEIDPEAIARFCSRWALAELGVFGSVLRDDFQPESDVDVLIQPCPGSHPTLFDMVKMAEELAIIFGRHVDLGTRRSVESDVNLLRRSAILGSLKVLYAA